MVLSDRQNEIIRAAFSLISEQGIQELTIKKLGAAIGISEPAIYRHFASKAEILSGIVDMLIALRNDTWRQAQAATSDPLECINLFFTLQAQQFAAFPPLSIVLFPEDLFRHDHSLLMRTKEIILKTHNEISVLIQQAKEEKTIRSDCAADTVSLLLIGGFRMLVSSWRLEAGTGKAIALNDSCKQFLAETMRILK